MMTFKSFIWPYNPKHVEISICKHSKTYNLPGLGPYVQFLGEDYRIVTGCGEFFGPDAITNFEKLFSVSKEHSTGKLFIPHIASMHAYFTELSIVRKSGPALISYKFKFVEDILKSTNISKSYRNNFYTLPPNENFEDVSHKFGSSVEQLLQ